MRQTTKMVYATGAGACVGTALGMTIVGRPDLAIYAICAAFVVLYFRVIGSGL